MMLVMNAIDVNAVVVIDRQPRADGVGCDMQEDRQEGVEDEVHFRSLASLLNTRSQSEVVTPKFTSAR